MFRILKQPYPFDEPASRAWIRAALIGAFVGLFLLTFQPFGTEHWQTPYKVWKLLGFGLVSFVITAFNFLVWPRLFPRTFKEESWTVGKAILFIMANILLIALGNQGYMALITDEVVGLPDIAGMILITFLIGIFPTAGTVMASYIIHLRRYVRQAAELPTHTAGTVSSSVGQTPFSSSDALSTAPLTLVAENEKDTLTFPAADLLFIESSDNYCTVVYLKDGLGVKSLLRSSLSRLTAQINTPQILRCHRSYVVNLDRVERVTGNAQGYRLHFLGGQWQIPVARQYNDTIVARLKSE
ncbi:LytTR family transcriptional regulator [Spirosoma taeanense]|uniref:LytTR family transcriptional regulator n=1 Tax=Spirosoma taeanense TaxID=2735870 RepID=A0A6M5YCA6_9BACT|nr:LytTR family DNA-binding domain-containing protein [Spirosoma taeanense]QJW91737.1 LytTR family transcriptional regulator [Spirosoma taeanense]